MNLSNHANVLYSTSGALRKQCVSKCKTVLSYSHPQMEAGMLVFICYHFKHIKKRIENYCV